jgi:hypothetical protein
MVSSRPELPEHRVAREVTVRVVDVLEVIEVEHHHRVVALVAPRAGGLLLDLLMEVALVVYFGEAVDRHQAVDLFVVLNFHIAARDELEDGSADLQLVAVAESDRVDELVVHVGAVRRAEVLDDVALVVEGDTRVVARHAFLVDLELALRRAANDQGLFGERHTPAHVVAVDHDEARIRGDSTLL